VQVGIGFEAKTLWRMGSKKYLHFLSLPDIKYFMESFEKTWHMEKGDKI
jgi:hypothetical protein